MSYQRLAIIENAGYEGERLVHECDTWQEANAYMDRQYSDDERDELHVDVAHWDHDEKMWSYDH